MNTILFIEVSPRGKESASRTVANTLAARLSAVYPSAKLVRRDLAADHLPHLDDITLRAISTHDAGEAERIRMLLVLQVHAVQPQLIGKVPI
jgi:FMN-dependent NADH-azoreductase